MSRLALALTAAVACSVACTHGPIPGFPGAVGAAPEARASRGGGPVPARPPFGPSPSPLAPTDYLPAPEAQLVGKPFLLSPGPEAWRITWRAADRDQARVRFPDPMHAVPLAPGALTLIAESPHFRAWYHLAVRAAEPRRPDDFVVRYHDAPRDGSTFPRPLVARDAETWARLWSLWCRDVRPPMPDVPEPCGAPWVDFPRRNVMFVEVDEQVAGSEEAVVTHVDGQAVHLVLPGVWLEGESVAWSWRYGRLPRGPAASPAPNPAAYALGVPALPPGARVALAPFPEAPRPSRASDLPEGDATAATADLPPATLFPRGFF